MLVFEEERKEKERSKGRIIVAYEGFWVITTSMNSNYSNKAAIKHVIMGENIRVNLILRH